MGWTMRARRQALDVGALDAQFLDSLRIEWPEGHHSWDIWLSFEAVVTLGLSMNAPLSVGLRQACLRLATQRLEERLRAGEIGVESGAAEIFWLLVEDVDDLQALIANKTCSYQIAQGPELYCAAADPADETAVGKEGLRTIAPTSAAMCRACNLPSTDFICSHLHHPGVLGSLGVSARSVSKILCDVGSEKASNPSMCHVGGHDCWVRRVDDPAIEAVPASGLALPEALDYMNLVWRARFGDHLIQPPALAKVAGLALPAVSRGDFVARLTEFADVIKMIKVPGEFLDSQGQPIPPDRSLARLEAFSVANLPPPDADEVGRGAAILRKINDLRTALQHSGTRKPLQDCLRELGLGYPPSDWGAAWDQVRGVATGAIAVIRDAVKANA